MSTGTTYLAPNALDVGLQLSTLASSPIVSASLLYLLHESDGRGTDDPMPREGLVETFIR